MREKIDIFYIHIDMYTGIDPTHFHKNIHA